MCLEYKSSITYFSILFIFVGLIMPEGQVVQKTETLATVESLHADFKALGIREGMILLVHSSLSTIGWVCGGAVAVIIALQEVLGEIRLPNQTCRPRGCPDFTGRFKDMDHL